MRRKLFVWTSVLSLMAFLPACSTSGSEQEGEQATQEESATMTEIDDNRSITTNTESNMKFELVKLPYEENALEPVISQRTIELHHGKHLQGYVDNLNKFIQGTEFEDMELVDIVKKSDGKIFNNAGQNLNHILYFLQFKPNANSEPTGDLAKAIEREFGSFADFKKKFEEEATGLFGSGWAWLATDKEGKLQITKEQNAGNPVTKDLIPLLGADVWEHAYYVDYENRRADHLKELWKIIDWEVVGDRYSKRAEKLDYK